MRSLPDVRYLEHESQVLRGNPMGDSHARRLPVYVPPGYDSQRRDPYPVVYVLSGWGGRGARYLNDDGVFTKSLPERLDEAILMNNVPPVLVAFPDCATKLGASQYINSEANGRYMDYLCDELVPLIDRNFHTHSSESYRGVTGHSSGGFGALVTAMHRPDRFLYVCSSAGDSWYKYLYTKSIADMVRVLNCEGGVSKFIQRFLSSPNPAGLLPREFGEVMMNLSMCACYAPNLSVPELKGDLYFDPKTGELVADVWEKFLAWDPVYMVDRFSDSLKKLKWIHLEAGLDDEYGLHLGHRQISKKLNKHGIPHVIEEYPGRHSGHQHRIPDRIRKMLLAMPRP